MPVTDGEDPDELIRNLKLAPHPEGGFYRETFRSKETDANGRSDATEIYFLLKAGQISRWHTVDATETWQWLAGSPLRLSLAPKGEVANHIKMGPRITAGEHLKVIVPPFVWQQSQSLGAWSLCACTVRPGFTFDGFTMAAPGEEPPFPT
jgi:uncharacterized protein